MLPINLNAQTNKPSQYEGKSGVRPAINSCCSIPEADLEFDWHTPPGQTWDDCSVVTGAAVIAYDTNGSTGSVEVCVTIRNQQSGVNYAEIYELGDFAVESTSGGFTELCSTFNYPEFDADGDIPGIKVLSFHVVPIDIERGSASSALVTGSSVVLSGATEDCDCSTGISLGFQRVKFLHDLTFGGFISNLYDENSLSRFQPPNLSPDRTVTILLKGELTVDEDYTLGDANGTQRSSLVFGDNSNVIVPDGVSLTIQNTAIGGCREMWEAITVEDGGTLHIRNSLVFGGEKAITVEDGGTLIAEKTEFKGNHRSIFTPADPDPNVVANQRVEIDVLGSVFDFKFREGLNTVDFIFSPAPFLLRPYYGEIPLAGIELNDTRFGTLVTGAGIQKTRFRNLANGIIADESRIYVTGSEFFDIPTLATNVNGSGHGIWMRGTDPFGDRTQLSITGTRSNIEGSAPVTFDRMKTAIFIERGPRMVRVRDTEIDAVENGMVADFAGRIFFHDNSVTATQFGFARNGYSTFVSTSRLYDNVFTAGTTPNATQPPAAINLQGIGAALLSDHRFHDNDIILDGAIYGLRSQAMDGVLVKDNVFNWSGQMFGTKAIAFEYGQSINVNGNLIEGTTGATFTEATGIEMSFVDGPTVYCNTIDLVETGLQFFGNNQQARISGNLMLESGIGLQLGADLPIGIADDPTAVGQQVHQGNRWVGPFTGFAAAYYNSDQFILRESQFFVDSDKDTDYLPNSLNPGSALWFRDQLTTIGTTYTCPDGLPPTNLIDDNDIVRRVVKQQYNPVGNWKASQWLADYRTLRAEETGRISSSNYPGWNNWRNYYTYTPGAIDTLGKFYAVEAIIKDLALVDSSDISTLDYYYGQLDQQEEEYVIATTSRFLDSTANVVPLDSLRQVYRDSMEFTDSLLIPLLASIDSTTQNRIVTAKIENGKLPVGQDPQDFRKQINAMQLDLLLGGTDTLSSHHADIISIAEQCPLDGGEAVYDARALASLLDLSVTTADSINCVNSAPKSFTGAETYASPRTDILVYPNPVQSQLSFRAGKQTITRFTLINSLGSRIFHQDIQLTPGVDAQFILPDLAAGMYIIRFDLQDNHHSTQLITVK